MMVDWINISLSLGQIRGGGGMREMKEALETKTGVKKGKRPQRDI